MNERSRRAGRVAALFCCLSLVGVPLQGQSNGDGNQGAAAEPDTLVYRLDAITVTATRTPRAVFKTPTPVSIVGNDVIRETSPNSVVDLFKNLPGLDLTGVGPSQFRPAIRGQRGQRILLLEDGLRLNNARRQQDFGELPALVDVTSVARVEVIRGPASVLYGSDAIGGVVNIVTRTPEEEGLHGQASYRYADMAGEGRASGRIYGRWGGLDLQVGATTRSADAYTAPAGSFGDITLSDDTPVLGTGVTDRSLDARLGYAFSESHRAFVKVEKYDSDDAGFGYVAPEAYAPDQPLIDIQYPSQQFTKVTGGYLVTGIESAVAERVEVLAYRQNNERELVLGLAQSFGPMAPPGAGLEIKNENFTDLGTIGGRLEVRKLATPSLLLTYGADFVRDDSEGSDVNTVSVVGFGPPQVERSTTPQIPNARYRSLGVFAQGEWELSDRASMVLGGRYQDLEAETRSTPGLTLPVETKSDRTLVGAANFIYALTDGLSAITSVGKAFRSPNLIEWFFQGPTPEGSGYQVRNPDLVAEQSLNVDVGLRYQRDGFHFEGFAFRNRIEDGIRIEATGEEVQGLPAFRNVNVDRLIFRGIELSAGASLGAGFSVSGSYTDLDTEDALDASNPVGESFSSKSTAGLRYDHPSDWIWMAYDVRHQGDRKDVDLEQNPIGAVLPAFTVHDVRGGIRLFTDPAGAAHSIGVSLHNLTNELYAEFSNISFFRPAPRRHLSVTWQVAF